MRLKTTPETQSKNLAILMDAQIHLAKYGLKFNIKEVLSASRKQTIVYARACIAYYFRHKGFSTLKIGQIINRDHASIVHILKYGNRKYHTSWNHEKYRDFVLKVNQSTSESLVEYHTQQLRFHLKELQKLKGTKTNKLSLEFE